ncbi:MAG: hypothetical protein KDD75_24205, partial [Caldilineaceae bacterium]|nr:hypothetical protein [Caldilineaceae bacterium]
TATIVSPIAWEHHYGILPPVFALLFAKCAERPPEPSLVVAFLLSATYIPLTKSLAATPLNVLQSYLYFGALIALLHLHRLQWPGRTWAPIDRRSMLSKGAS